MTNVKSKTVKTEVEDTVKAGVAAAAAGFEQVASMTQQQAEKVGTAAFKSYGDWSDYGRRNMEAMVAASTAWLKGVETVSREVASFAQKSLDANVEIARKVSGCDSVQEVVDLQNVHARSAFDSIVAESAKIAEMTSQVANEAMLPLNQRVTDAFQTMANPTAA